MYMYYLLSHKLQDEKSADNTFILALDGDVDFQPSALKLLVDIMKQNSKVGAACGRILPIGSGKAYNCLTSCATLSQLYRTAFEDCRIYIYFT